MNEESKQIDDESPVSESRAKVQSMIETTDQLIFDSNKINKQKYINPNRISTNSVNESF